MKEKHRNSQGRIYFEDGVYFVTTNTKNWVPFFEEKIFCDLFVGNLKLCKKLKGFQLYAWFLGYDHFHLLMQPGDEWNYSKIMQFLKCHTSRNINIVMGYTTIKSDKPPEGAIGQSRLRGNDDSDIVKTIKQFDQYILNLRNQFIQKYSNEHPFPKFRWHKSFHDHFTRDDKDFGIKWNYIKNNPIKHNMPDDPPVGRAGWPYVFTNPKYENLLDNIY